MNSSDLRQWRYAYLKIKNLMIGLPLIEPASLSRKFVGLDLAPTITSFLNALFPTIEKEKAQEFAYALSISLRLALADLYVEFSPNRLEALSSEAALTVAYNSDSNITTLSINLPVYRTSEQATSVLDIPLENFDGDMSAQLAQIYVSGYHLSVGILNTVFEGLVKYFETQPLYANLPKSTETYTDTTTITPDQTTSYSETYNPVNTPSGRDRLKTQTSVSGTTKQTVIKASGRTALDLLSDIRNIPFLVDTIIQDVRQKYTIDYNTLMDALECDLLPYAYIDYDD